MTNLTAIQSSIAGIQTGLRSAAENSSKIASTSINGGDLTPPLIELSQNKLQVQASTKSLQINQDMLGSLLDLKA